ncbi:hypothetical protein SISSUDRAFT_509143 [Sistotremastrum suecicum HHB10207 ss-3]|uniref:Uncharacterized protein n=1 Tax=Sistotremastrum suecicum HHB10207 ss-3 TaxID=1314776 RepID=A0A166IMT0_9AGAM|nr:hypothetical protein SISSUDRAFT_509143 [Sistotremastrum suecicum HHB10207 ss-3]
MTLTIADGPPKTGFVIFYASRDENGEMWCPVRAVPMRRGRVNGPGLNVYADVWCGGQDCRAVEQTIADVFGPDEGPDCVVVYVGARAEYVLAVGGGALADEHRWKAPGNAFRETPWKVRAVPTLVAYSEVSFGTSGWRRPS